MSYKVSIVVPIYKVEKYIQRCVDSILGQTYSDLEIILVDDGSPDKCGEIIDEYLNKDSRIKVVHKKNGGLSDARNVGVKYITGEYILFVDSDDWIENGMIEEMINICHCYKADVVQAAFYYAYEDCLFYDSRYNSKDASPDILYNPDLMYELVINQRVKNFAWGKLYKSEIIKDVPFEKGVLFEDVFWAHKIMHRVDTYVIIQKPLYYYYQRSDSIVATYTPRNLDMIKGLKQRHTFLEEYYEDLLEESYKVILRTSLIHYNLLFINRKKDKGGFYKKEIQSYIKIHYKKLMKSVEDDQQLRYQLLLFRIHPTLNMLFLLIRRLLRMIKIIPQPLGLERVNR